MLIATLAALLVLQAAADSLTLDAALARARAARPRVAGAAAGVARARGAQRVLAAIPNPTSQVEMDDAAPTYKATVIQSLAWLPRRGADLAAGRAGVERARADSAQSLADLGREVARAFFGALAAERQFHLVTEQRALADSLAALAARRALAGDISDLERDQVVQEAARAGLAASQARESERVARLELGRAVAWDAPQAPAPAGRLDVALDDVARAGDDVAISGGGLDSLPGLRAARSDSAAASARLRAARIARVPIPGIVVGREWGGGANATLGLAMPLPLWTRGGEAVAEASGAAAERTAALAEARLTLAARLEQARARLAESAARARFARDTLLPEARRVRAGAVRLYEAGRTGVIPVLDALRTEGELGRAAVAELLAFQEARADLAALLGRWP